MSEITTEHRLRLVQQIRQENTQNRQRIQSRERILYGNDLGYDYSVSKGDDEALLTPTLPQSSTFGFRMFIAAVLLVGYFFLESSNLSLGALDAEVIRTEVNRYSGVEINLFDFMDNITYTFNND